MAARELHPVTFFDQHDLGFGDTIKDFRPRIVKAEAADTIPKADPEPETTSDPSVVQALVTFAGHPAKEAAAPKRTAARD